jgi:site-specific recombinase XerD
MKKILKWKETKSNQVIEEEKNKNEIEIEEGKVIGLFERFLRETDIQENSKETYFKGLKKFLTWLSKESEEKIKLSKEKIIEYKNTLIKTKLRPHTQATYFVITKQFFSWAEANLILPNIAKTVKGIKKITKQHHKDPLKKEEIKTLIKEEKKERKKIEEIRNAILVKLLIFTGIRIGEASNIKLEDIEEEKKKTIIWIKGKGRTSKDNFVFLIKELAEEIKKYIEKRQHKENINEESYLFPSHKKTKRNTEKMNPDSLSRIVREEMKKKGIKRKKVTAHSLRHSFGVNALESGASLHDVQIAMRHSSPTTTQIYLGDIEKMKRKEGTIEKIIYKKITKKK